MGNSRHNCEQQLFWAHRTIPYHWSVNPRKVLLQGLVLLGHFDNLWLSTCRVRQVFRVTATVVRCAVAGLTRPAHLHIHHIDATDCLVSDEVMFENKLLLHVDVHGFS